MEILFDNTKTYLFDNQDTDLIQRWKIKQMPFQIATIIRRVKKENTLFEEWEEFEEKEPEWKTSEITAVLIDKDQPLLFYVSAGNEFSGSLYRSSFNSTNPLKMLKNNKELINYLSYSDSKRYIIQGTKQGRGIIRMYGSTIDNYMELPLNGNGGVITSIKMNFLDNLLAATTEDGILTVRQLDKEMIESKAKESKDLPEPCR